MKHDVLLQRSNSLVQQAWQLNDDCISCFDLIALKSFYKEMHCVIKHINQSLTNALMK